MVWIKVLHVVLLHCVALRTVGLPIEGALDVARPTSLRRRFRAHSPACVHLCAVSDRWSKQKVWWQESHRKGRKSSTLQYSNSQCAPIASTSLSIAV